MQTLLIKYFSLTLFTCLISTNNSQSVASPVDATTLTKNEQYTSLLKDNSGTTDASFIVIDTSIKIDDVLKTDSNNIGYVRYLFTAKIVFPGHSNTHHSDKVEHTEIKYFQIHEGDIVPDLSGTLYAIGVCKNTTNEHWSILSNGYKIPLSNPALQLLAESLIINPESKRNGHSKTNSCIK